MNQKRRQDLEKHIKQEHQNITGIVVRKDGDLFYENYFGGFSQNDAFHVFSVTKSVLSALIGIAADEGDIKSVSQPIREFFSDYHGDVTILQLLTMTAPYKCETELYEEFFRSEDWVGFALEQLGEKPAGAFRYSPIIGAHILSGVLEKATGRRITDFAAEKLFLPLGITPPKETLLKNEREQMAFYDKKKHNNGWVLDPQGIATGSWGLTLTPFDMAKIGQLYLNRGIWGEKRIISSDWIQKSTKEHSRWNDPGLGYGYLWWVIDEDRRIYAAMGDGGNVTYINEEQGLVVAIAALFAPEVNDRIELIEKYILPMGES